MSWVGSHNYELLTLNSDCGWLTMIWFLDIISQLEIGKPDEKRKPEKRVNGIFWILLLNLGIYAADHLFQVNFFCLSIFVKFHGQSNAGLVWLGSSLCEMKNESCSNSIKEIWLECSSCFAANIKFEMVYDKCTE